MARWLALPALLALLVWPSSTSGGQTQSQTWAGTWRTTYGSLTTDMTLDAGGNGTYDFCDGTISGNVRKAGGANVLEGTWTQSFPCGGAREGRGPFEFTMTASGRSFVGLAAYASDPPGEWDGAWNGACIAGECLNNRRPDPPDRNVFGTKSIAPPPPGVPVKLASPAIPTGAETVTAEVGLRDAMAARAAMGMLVRAYVERERERANERRSEQPLTGCMILGGVDPDGDWNVQGQERVRAVYLACMKLLAKSLDAKPARPSAAGCKSVVVPIYRGSKRPSRRQHRRIVARLNASVKASCKQPSTGPMTVNVSPRGKGNTVRKLLGKKVRAGYARASSPGESDGPNAQLDVTWKAR